MAKTADEARAEAAARTKQDAAKNKVTPSPSTVAATKAKQTAADNAAIAKAGAAKGAAAKAAKIKEDTYIQSLENPITSQYDPRIQEGGRVTAGGDISYFNPEMASTQMTSTGQTPEEAAEEIKPKKIIVPPLVPPVPPKEISDNTRDAFAMLTDLFNSYGLEGLAGEIAGYMASGLTASEALIKLKTNPGGAYAKRFAGNFTRIKNGLNAISEAAYIGLENSYASTLKDFGLGNMVSLNREDNYKKFADYISGDISADEFKDRVKTVVTRVQNADPSIKATLKAFYPEISDNDLVSYFLNPKENLPKLQEKVTASEIGAAATGAGLTTNVGTATDLAKYGVDQKTAREGYSTISGILPTSTKLGDIYNESGVRYAQAEGEAEVFKGSQDAATKRNRLASMERGSFSGSAGRLASQSKNAGLI